MERTCARCKREISAESAYVCLTYNIEQPEFDLTTLRESVTVISSEEVLTLCGRCGNKFNPTVIRQIIKAIPM